MQSGFSDIFPGMGEGLAEWVVAGPGGGGSGFLPE